MLQPGRRYDRWGQRSPITFATFCAMQDSDSVRDRALSRLGELARPLALMGTLASRIVKAAGAEPTSMFERKMQWRATSVARARFSAGSVAPSSHSSPLQSPGVHYKSWRHSGDGRTARLGRVSGVELGANPSKPVGHRAGRARTRAGGRGVPRAAVEHRAVGLRFAPLRRALRSAPSNAGLSAAKKDR
jgi:hypothetical protein